MANTGVLTTASSVDRRNQEPNAMPVWEMVLTYTVEAGGGATELTVDLPINGILQKIVADSNAAGGISGTFNLAIDDEGDQEIFAVTGLIEDTAYKYNVWEPVAGTINVGVNPSDDPTTGEDDWVITIVLRGI